MPLIPLLAALLLSSARAGEEPATTMIIFGAQTTRDALSQVSRATGQARESLQATPLEALLAQVPPRVVGDGAAEACTTGLVPISVFEAEAHASVNEVKNNNANAALAHARVAAEALGCLAEPPDPALVAELGLFWGVAALSQGLAKDAHDAFTLARTFDRDLAWPAGLLESRGKAVFDSVLREERQTLPVLLEVLPRDTALWVDGRPIQDATRGVRLPAGTHVIHIGAEAPFTPLLLHLETGGGSTLVLPDRIDARAVAWVEESRSRADLSLLLAAVLGQGAPVYVAPEGSVWKGSTGGADWSRLDRSSGGLVAGGLMLTGGGLAVGGGSAMLATWALGRQARLNNDVEAYERYRKQFAVAEPFTYAGAIALGVGVGLKALGLRGVAVGVAPDAKNSLTGVVVWSRKW